MTSDTLTTTRKANLVTIELDDLRSNERDTRVLVCGMTALGQRRWWQETVGQADRYSFELPERPTFERLELMVCSRNRAPIFKAIAVVEALARPVTIPRQDVDTIQLNVWVASKYSKASSAERSAEVAELTKRVRAYINIASDVYSEVNPAGIRFELLDDEVKVCNDYPRIMEVVGTQVATANDLINLNDEPELPRNCKVFVMQAPHVVNVYVVPGVYHKFDKRVRLEKESRGPWGRENMTYPWEYEEAEAIELRGQTNRDSRNTVYVSSRIAADNTLAHELGHVFGLDDFEQTVGRNLMRLPPATLLDDELGTFRELTLEQIFRIRRDGKSFIRALSEGPEPSKDRKNSYPPIELPARLDSDDDVHTH